MVKNVGADRRESAPSGIQAILKPSSVAIIGMSQRAGSGGQVVLGNLLAGGYSGSIHLVGRSGGEIMGHPVLSELGQLPEGIDLAILMVPAEAVLETIQLCVARKVRAAVCFASGFAEMGEAGREAQRQIADVARAGGLTLLGPNTVGYFNYVDGFYVMLVELDLPARFDPSAGRGVAVAAQSGGLGAHIAASLIARGVPLTYMMTTGNEAQTGLAEMIEFFSADSDTGAVVVYAEQIRDPSSFLAAAQRARAQGKAVVLLHPGRSEKSRAAAQSHTGALAGNHGAMRTICERAGVLVVDSLEEAIDLGQLLLRFPKVPEGGLGLVTASGAICGVAQDYVEPLGLVLPPLAVEQAEKLRAHLPDFTPPRNPLDLGTLVAWKPELIELGLRAILDDPAISSVLVSMPLPAPEASVVWLNYFLKGLGSGDKPAILVMQNEDVPLAKEFTDLARRERVIIMRSPERAIRALAQAARFGRIQRDATHSEAAAAKDLPADIALPSGVVAEWESKAVFKRLGVTVPPGGLARTPEEALAVADAIGYPVVLKVQSPRLPHKSDIGGVLLRIGDADALRTGWKTLHENVARLAPGVELDGILVEAMGFGGLELVVGATRDDAWGPLVMVGLGGIWIEVLKDVQLLAPDLPKAAIVERLRSLRAAALLDGVRGAPPVDLESVAEVVALVGRLMLARPDISEIDINPLIARPFGEDALALDALIVTKSASGDAKEVHRAA